MAVSDIVNHASDIVDHASDIMDHATLFHFSKAMGVLIVNGVLIRCDKL